jgi:predicted small lipoprotein YifL
MMLARPTARRRHLLSALGLLLTVLVVLGGCGKKGEPTPPRDEPNIYPRTYPHE